MNSDSIMRIKPFEEHKDELFTDYIIQLFNAHCSENSHEMIKYLVDSLQEEALENEAFMPGLIFGCMVHMLMMMQVISVEKGLNLEEATQDYIKMYQSNRKGLAKMLGNRPDYAREMINKIHFED